MVKLHLWRRFLPWLTRTFPSWVLSLASDLLPWRALREMKAISNSLHMASRLVLKQRKDDIQQEIEGVHDHEGGKDLMSFLRTSLLGGHALSLTRSRLAVKENMMSGDIDSLSESDLLGQMSYVSDSNVSGVSLMCLFCQA